MTNLLSDAIAYIGSLFKGIQIKQFLAAVLFGVLLLTTNTDPNKIDGKAVTDKIDRVIHQGDSDRPKTTGEWNKEARQTEGAPGERLNRIAKESGEAIKDWGKMYPDTAKDSARELSENTR